eukprot:s2035_g3.t1
MALKFSVPPATQTALVAAAPKALAPASNVKIFFEAWLQRSVALAKKHGKVIENLFQSPTFIVFFRGKSTRETVNFIRKILHRVLNFSDMGPHFSVGESGSATGSATVASREIAIC